MGNRSECMWNNVRHINGSLNTTVFIIIYYVRATCFDSFESSSGPPMRYVEQFTVVCSSRF